MLVLGDAHADDPANRRALLSAYDAEDPDAALQVGDLLHYDLPAPTWFVAGNNEDFDVVEALRAGEGPAAARNATLLASTAADVEGLRVAGLSGNYAPTQYDRPRADLAGDRRRHFTREDVERAKALGTADVVLTHEAPRGFLGRGSPHVDEVLSALDPALCLVGHHHRHAEGHLGDTRLVGLAPAWEGYYVLDPETLSLERCGVPADP